MTILFLTGIEFFFLGALLGPSFLDLISVEVLDDLKPVVYLALGWAGVLFGIQLSWQHIRRLSRKMFELLSLDAALSTVLFLVIFLVVLGRLFPQSGQNEVLFGAAAFAVTAAINSPTIVAVLAHRLPARGKFTSMVRIATSLSAVIPLVLFGILFTIMNPGMTPGGGLFSGLAWWVFANLFAVVMGFVFVLLTTQKATRDQRLLIIIGTVMLVGGLCYFLTLSALYTAMIMGVVVGNFSPRRVQIFEQLMSMERTIYVAFLVFVGAMVTFNASHLFLLLVFYVVSRIVVRIVVSSWAIRVSFPEFSGVGFRSGLSLSAQGGMALAVALDFAHGDGGDLVESVVSVIVVAVVVNEILGVFLTRQSLVAIGDAKPSQRRSGGGNQGEG
ncbi:MAG: cation:proton antiporter [Candidatus Latescibacterota bacterium]|nr:MAG: cation:proton antiporter [Candidatus Latescibacterota bacterium]